MPFIDRIRIEARAGNGGDGCLSFRREKYVPRGGPDGGSGGRGGDVWLAASKQINTLYDLSLRPHLIADSGNNGRGSNKTGAAGQGRTAMAPVGTTIYESVAAAGRQQQDGAAAPSLRFVKELVKDNEKFCLAHGGRGGRGNTAFKTAFNRAPRQCEKGFPGERKVFILELKLLADVGLVGLPNAGKSTLLASVTKARPRIAAYPFTTTFPVLGVCHWRRHSFVMADIPGLIEGASSGRGLGDEFLRHIEKTKALIHVVAPQRDSGMAPLASVAVVEREMAQWSRDLLRKPRVVVISKADLGEDAETAFKRINRQLKKQTVILFSAHTGQGKSALLDAVAKLV